ncbi:hypothetical protein scyTo_0006752 [Scyliorhinus torazame]|uniref:CARD domain-containing protein n=1 Tax=Scyliorhinus torazame TaxID=75743 RepID=A0A401PJT9_SCYTO|nr:hypothetical protein [Scyliorhinus torazame]
MSVISTHSFIKLLKLHREILVGRIKNTECVLDNLIKHEYISGEEAELSQQHPTQAAKVRKILDLVESKGEETAEYFLHILYQASEVYANLSPWLVEIQYQPSDHILTKSVIITDAVCQYIQKIKHDLRQDTKFVTSYVQKEDTLLDDTYTESLMELINAVNETKGNISHLEDLFSDTGVINEDAETVFVTGDAGATCSSQQLLGYVTLTDIYLLMLEVFLNRSSKAGLNKGNKSQNETFKAKRDALLRLGKLAKEGIENSSFIFSQEQITAADISEEDLQLGFVKNTGHYDGCGNQSTYEFLHLTLQSLFAAFSLVVDEEISAKELIKFFSKCDSFLTGARANVLLLRCLGYSTHHRKDPFETNEHLQFTMLFLCGLLSKTKRDLFKHLASTGSVQRKHSALKAYLADCVKVHLKNLPKAAFEEFSRVQVLPRFVWLLRYIFETQSEAIANLAAKGICADYIKLTFCNAFSADCSAIANILRHRKKSIALELDNNNINDYGVKELIPCFDKLTVVRLSVNQITDDGAKVLAEELTKYKIIKILGLYRNQITDVGAQFIAQIVEECPCLRTLKIGLNKLTSEGGKLLAQAIQKSKVIRDVGMWGNQIGDAGAVAFAEAIRNHPSIRELSLAANGISAEGGKSLAVALKDNRSLEIFWLTENQLNDEAAELFAEALRFNKSLLHLWVINNKITEVGAKYFFEILKENATIEEICLNGNCIPAEEAKRFAKDKRILL